MRTYDEVVDAVIEQVMHGIKRCGWDYQSEVWSLRECIELAQDMVMTLEEMDAYGDGMTRTILHCIAI